VVFADGNLDCGVLLAASGRGAAALEREVLMRGPGWGARRAADAPGGRWVVSDASNHSEVRS
jgi:hypothetical protein